jgi:hypothetical protein
MGVFERNKLWLFVNYESGQGTSCPYKMRFLDTN